MFQALATKRPRKTQITRISSVPAPVGGWNARDSYAAMGASDAVILENFFPLPYAVSLRKGFTEWVTGITDPVETVLQYRPPTGNGELFAAAGANIFDVSSSGAVGAAEVSALTSAQWQYINFSVGGTAYLYAVNGADKPLLYNGATWTPIDGASVPAVTGVTTTTLANINIHKTRVWFCENGTLKAWYLPTNAVGGAALALDLSNLCQRGGYLVTMATWSYDNGRGMDDYAVFVTSEGEVIVYQGTDPASSATWSLVGVYAIGTPLGRRCAVKYGGDLLLISQFTLQASTKKGNRPSYIKASKPFKAVPLYENFILKLEQDLEKKISTGVFGADMQVSLLNDGPVTIVIDSKRKE